MSDQDEREYRPRPADERSLSHDEVGKGGVSEPADFIDAPDDAWPDDKVWDLGDGVFVTQKQLREHD
jgi:hypothetical protein